MAEIDLGRLLRLKEMIASAAGVDPANATSVYALAKSYGRLRAQVAATVEGSSLEQEFEGAFPSADQVGRLPQEPQMLRSGGITHSQVARDAQALLAQLAGWVEGLIAEQTLERRLELEATERVKQERRQSPGFQG